MVRDKKHLTIMRVVELAILLGIIILTYQIVKYVQYRSTKIVIGNKIA